MSGPSFTPNAQRKIADLLAEENTPNLKLRMFVQGGGCSGFQYGFTFDDTVAEDDLELTLSDAAHPSVVILVDAMSMAYVQDAEVDYVEDLMGASFQVKNPNATTTCGCGSSFSV
jgi:iron-sulfur cluster insertion protein